METGKRLPSRSFVVSSSKVPMSWRSGRSRKRRFDGAEQIADTNHSVRQGTTGPRQGNNPTCFDSDSVLCIFFQPVSAGHRAILKGDLHDRIKASRSSLPGVTSQTSKKTGA